MTMFNPLTTEPEDSAAADNDELRANTGNRFLMGILFVLRLPRKLLQRLYEWTIRWARTRKAPYALFLTAFVESSVFPIPPDALLIPMVVSRREKWFKYALICTIGSVTGALLGYLIGWVFFESVGRKIVDIYNLQHSMDLIGDKYSRNAFLTIFTAAFTPIPYKVITIGAGLFNVSIITLVFASLIGRAGRFFMVAGLLRIFGERISGFMEKNFDRFFLAFLALIVAGFLALKYLR